MIAKTAQPRALPDHIDAAAEQERDATWAKVPLSSSSLEAGWTNLSFSHLSRAVDAMAWWMEKNIGLGHGQQTIGYMGTNDLRYLVVLAAALKTGFVPLFTSPRNSLEGQEYVLRQTNCSTFLYSEEVEGQVKSIKDVVPELQIFQTLSLNDIVHPKESFPAFEGRHQQSDDARCLILHTSGSTGLPKPIYLTVGGLNSLHQISSLPSEGEYRQVGQMFLADRRPMLASVPFFHAMGIIVAMRSIMCRGQIIRLPANLMLNAGLVLQAIELTKPFSAIFPPSILEDISATEQGVQALGNLEYVFFGGAPLARESGDKICKVTNLLSVIGSTECGFFGCLMPPAPEDWQYFHWSSESGVVMEPAEQGLYEMVIRPKDTRYQAVFHTFPGLEEWRTKDLFQAHPTVPNLWKYSGRRDDVIVLSNGEKFTPVSTEKLLESHPLLKGALVVGEGRFQAGLLLEPDTKSDAAKDPSRLIESVWPLVEKANKEAPAHARIFQSKIAVAKADKPFHRAAKGSVIRRATLTQYEREIDDLYADDVNECTSSSDFDGNLKGRLREVFRRVLPAFEEGTPDDKDVFDLGIDSLDVLALASSLSKSFNAAGKANVAVSARTIYDHPSVEKLANHLESELKSSNKRSEITLSREGKLAEIVGKHVREIIYQRRNSAVPARPTKSTVVVTGSTGSLGGYLLEQLIARSDVEKIYCLNRSTDAEARQKESFKKYDGAPIDFSKVSFLTTNFGEERFGLCEETYAELQSAVTTFIHSAWSVDFNKSVDFYESVHITGTRRVVDFAASATFKPDIIFVSSIASVGCWPSLTTQDGSSVPESVTTVFDNSLPFPQGYGESKHVSSQILAVASHRLGIRTATVRAGQLAGPSEEHANGGAWNRHEWVPTLVHTSKVLGKIPRTLGNQDRVDWVPMDKAAGTLIDISMSMSQVRGQQDGSNDDHRDLTNVHHLTNPRETSWRELYPVIQDFFLETEGVHLEAVDYDEWIGELRTVPATKENAEKVPGLKLLAFYESLRPQSSMGLPVLATRRTEASSETLRRLRPVDGGLMRKWLGQWGF